MKKTSNSLLKANRKNDRTPNNFFADISLLYFDELSVNASQRKICPIDNFTEVMLSGNSTKC